MKKLLAVLAALVAAVAMLSILPGPIDPVVWEPPPAAPPSAATAVNQRLKGVEVLAPELPGPETIFLDPAGNLLTGLLDGRVVRLKPGGGAAETLVNTGGRPMAMAYHPDGRLIIADAHQGLLALDATGKLEVLAREEGGVPFRFLDDLVIASDGTVYFTDASSRRSVEVYELELLEHRQAGRVLAWKPGEKPRKVFGDFAFPNGIALGPEEAFLVVSETGDYRLWRLWLKGDKAGTRELFGPPLPGFPDNVRPAAGGGYWVAIGSLRKPEVDGLAAWPRLRSLVARLPRSLQPAPDHHAYALKVGADGTPVESLQDVSEGSYSPVSCVTEGGGFLYLGSFVRSGVARLPFPKP